MHARDDEAGDGEEARLQVVERSDVDLRRLGGVVNAAEPDQKRNVPDDSQDRREPEPPRDRLPPEKKDGNDAPDHEGLTEIRVTVESPKAIDVSRIDDTAGRRKKLTRPCRPSSTKKKNRVSDATVPNS